MQMSNFCLYVFQSSLLLAHSTKVLKEWCGKLKAFNNPSVINFNVKENKIFSFLFLLILNSFSTNRKFLKITFLSRFSIVCTSLRLKSNKHQTFLDTSFYFFSKNIYFFRLWTFSLYFYFLWPQWIIKINDICFTALMYQYWKFTQIIYMFLLFLSVNNWMILQKWKFFRSSAVDHSLSITSNKQQKNF